RDGLLSRMGEGGFSWRGTSLEKPGEGLALVEQPPDPHPSPLGSFLAKRRSPLPQGERGRSGLYLRLNFQREMRRRGAPLSEVSQAPSVVGQEREMPNAFVAARRVVARSSW